jgi:pyruvate carboxylase
MAPLSGLTSQPNLNALVEAFRFHPRETGLDPEALLPLARYWGAVREFYTPFEADQKSADPELYVHEMPGGQSTNLYQQAQALGLGRRWSDVCRMYGDVNRLLGDIVKVTPTSKAVGDMALFLLANNLSAADVLDPKKELAYPESVIDLVSGRLGQPHGGFPPEVVRRILREQKALRGRPGASLKPTDLKSAREEVRKIQNREPAATDVASYLLYPRVFQEFAEHQNAYSDTSVLPTPVFLYGLSAGQETAIDIEPGKTLIIKHLTVSDPHADGRRTVFFELNGIPRDVTVVDRALEPKEPARPKADASDPWQVAAPMPGLVVNVAVQHGARVARGQKLLSLEAMKMETTLYAERDARVAEVLVRPGTQVESGELVVRLMPAGRNGNSAPEEG